MTHIKCFDWNDANGKGSAGENVEDKQTAHNTHTHTPNTYNENENHPRNSENKRANKCRTHTYGKETFSAQSSPFSK